MKIMDGVLMYELNIPDNERNYFLLGLNNRSLNKGSISDKKITFIERLNKIDNLLNKIEELLFTENPDVYVGDYEDTENFFSKNKYKFLCDFFREIHKVPNDEMGNYLNTNTFMFIKHLFDFVDSYYFDNEIFSLLKYLRNNDYSLDFKNGYKYIFFNEYDYSLSITDTGNVEEIENDIVSHILKVEIKLNIEINEKDFETKFLYDKFLDEHREKFEYYMTENKLHEFGNLNYFTY